MQIQLSVSPQQVIAIVEREGESAANDRLLGQAGALQIPKFAEWRDRIWNQIQDAVKDVSEKGATRVNEWLSVLQGTVDDAKRDLGVQADAILAEIQQRLVNLCRELQKALLDLLPVAVTTTRGQANLQEIAMQYEVSVSNTLTVSLNFALQLAGGAKFAVSAKYAF